MLFNDRVYGKIEITEPIILELLNSPTLLRLKDIDQGGYTKPFVTDVIYRFDHSIGVYWLLKKYQTPLAEQVAGLIHDVSHSAFSHSIDYILKGGDGGKQNHQDNVFENFVRKSEIPTILKKYNLDIDYILSDHNFPLKERQLPDLCADRIDYSLRTALMISKVTLEEVNYFLDNLIIQDSQWVFKTLEAVEKYAQLFLWLNNNYWISVTAAAMHLAVGDCISYALEKNYITNVDLYTTDSQIIEKIKPFITTDDKLDFFWKRMNNKSYFSDNPSDYYQEVSLKSRVVDPLFLDQGKIKRLSEVKNEWLKIITEGLKPKSCFIKFED